MRNEILNKTYNAEGVIGAYCIVKWGAADGGILVAAAATDKLIGVNKSIAAAAANDRIDIVRQGIAEVLYGGTVTRGDFLTSDSSGYAVAAGEGDQVIGRAEVSGVSGDIGSVLLGCAPAPGQTYIQETTITSAQLLALHATPQTIVTAPGAGKAIVPVMAELFLDYNDTAYDGIAAGEDLNIRYTDGSGALLATIETTGFLDATADDVRFVLPVTTAAFTPVANAALVLYLATDEIATGNSPLKVRVHYKIIDTAW